MLDDPREFATENRRTYTDEEKEYLVNSQSKGGRDMNDYGTRNMKVLAIVLWTAAVVLLVIGFCAKGVIDAQVREGTFAWDANTEPDLAGYRLYYGQTPRSEGPYTKTYNIPVSTYSADGNILDIGWLNPGPWYFSLTAYDEADNESEFSNEVGMVVPDTVPETPYQFQMQFTAPDGTILNVTMTGPTNTLGRD